MITSFNDLFAELKAKGIRKRMVAAWGVDSHTIEAASKAADLGFVEVTLVGDESLIAKVCEDFGIDAAKFRIVDIKEELKAVAHAVKMVHDGEGDVLMKGLCSTDKLLRAILNKETGLLPPKGLLSHVGVLESPHYHKLIFMGDMAAFSCGICLAACVGSAIAAEIGTMKVNDEIDPVILTFWRKSGWGMTAMSPMKMSLW